MESPYPVQLRIDHGESVARWLSIVKYFSLQSIATDPCNYCWNGPKAGAPLLARFLRQGGVLDFAPKPAGELKMRLMNTVEERRFRAA
jgi:hypothetical protein